jgi:prevent-host-death family protein
MKTWPVQDAKAHFSEMLDNCVAGGPQLVSKRGTVTAVLVPIKQWEQLQASQSETLKDLLLSDAYCRVELDIPPRGKSKHRPPIEF